VICGRCKEESVEIDDFANFGGRRNSAKFARLATAQRLLVFKSDRVNHTFGNNIKCFKRFVFVRNAPMLLGVL